jgi:hypothetical protein
MKKWFLCFGLALLTSCSTFQGEPTDDGKKLRHIVVVWLKKNKDSYQQAKLLQAGRDLRAIEGVESIAMGRCIPSDRPIVDSTFDVAYIMNFKDQTALQNYLQHPKHVQAVKTILKPLAKKILVYDFMDE